MSAKKRDGRLGVANRSRLPWIGWPTNVANAEESWYREEPKKTTCG